MAHRDGEVIASAESYDELSDKFEGGSVDWDEKVIIEYVERPDLIRVL